LTHQTF
ncbi:unnamed protein product, partial [Rotaria sordida]